MPKNKHSKDRLFVTATEWARDYGGKKAGKNATTRPLAFDCCALSLAPFETPVCTKEGVVFDILNIIPYIKKHKKNPVNGEALTSRDLIRLNYARNTEGKWHCPVTFKVFNNNSRILAIQPSRNVYAAEAVEELNFKAKNWSDLLTGESFTKKEVIVLNDPSDATHVASRDVNNFQHLKEVREGRVSELEKASHVSNIRQTKSTEIIMREIGDKRKRDAAEKVIKEEKHRQEVKARELAGIAAGERLWKRQKVTTEDLVEGRVMTSGKTSGSLTSSALTVSTDNSARDATDAEVDEARWSRQRKLGKKGYCQLQTSKGNINVEVHCDVVPRMAENFIGLCGKGYYDGTKFHRSIRNFMLQGGDPSGTGKGGESYWGGKIKDEFESRMVHDKRGVLSMANAGPDTNGSQFFITYKSCRHLDNVHSVFGRVVGGMAALSAIESVATDSKDRPEEDVLIRKVVVFTNPIDEMEDLLEKELQAKIEEREAKKAGKVSLAAKSAKDQGRIGWGSNPTPETSMTKTGGVGKYLGAAAKTTLPRQPVDNEVASKGGGIDRKDSLTNEKSGKGKGKGVGGGSGGFGDFSSW